MGCKKRQLKLKPMSQPQQEVGQMWPNPRLSIQQLKIKHVDCKKARVEHPWRSPRRLDSPSPAGWARTSTRTSIHSCHGSEHVIRESMRASVTGTQLQKQRGRSVWHRSWTLTVSGAGINPGTWTGPTEPYVPSHPAYDSRLCDSFSTAEHHFPPRNKSGIYAFFWMGLHEVGLGVLDFFFFFFYRFLIVSWSPGVFCGGKGFDDFCLCSMVMLHAMHFPLLPQLAPGTCLWWPLMVIGGVFLDQWETLKPHICVLVTKKKEKKRKKEVNILWADVLFYFLRRSLKVWKKHKGKSRLLPPRPACHADSVKVIPSANNRIRSW